MMGPILPSEVRELAPLPASIGKLCAIINRAETTIGEIARIIELDQALTANTLRIANSVWSGNRDSIASVRQAVVRLGTARILGLALARHMASYFKQPFDGYQLAEQELWRHSIAAAIAAENLSKFSSQRIPAEAFTAALMHDIGKLLLTRYIDSERLNQIRDLMQNENYTYIEAERKVLETDHTIIGAAIARHWQFPEELVVAIEHHHDPDPKPDVLMDAVHIANAIAKLVGVGLGSEEMNMRVSSGAVQRLGLKRNGLEVLCVMVKQEVTNAEELYRSN